MRRFLHTRQALIQNVTRPGFLLVKFFHMIDLNPASSAATGRLERSFSGIDAKETRRAKVVSPKLAAKKLRAATPRARQLHPHWDGEARGSSSGES